MGEVKEPTAFGDRVMGQFVTSDPHSIDSLRRLFIRSRNFGEVESEWVWICADGRICSWEFILNPTPVDAYSPDPLASIAESLEKIANPMIPILDSDVAFLSESEKFFRHLNNGEVALEQIGWQYTQSGRPEFRITITEKGLTQ